MKVIIRFIISLLFLLFLSHTGCKKDQVIVFSEIGHCYYPLIQGKFNVYRIDSVIWVGNQQTGLTSVDTSSFQFREYIDTTYYNGEEKLAYRILQQRRLDSSYLWKTVFVSYVVQEIDHLKKLEIDYLSDNGVTIEYAVVKVKQIYPVHYRKLWNGNSYNSMGNEEYRYSAVHEPEVINGFTFDSVTTVLQDDKNNLIDSNLVYEKYAASTGLVEKYEIHAIKQLATQMIVDGYQVKYQIIDSNF